MDTEANPQETYRGWLDRVPEYLSGVALGALAVLIWDGAHRLPPDRVPMHFDWSGAPDRWGGRGEFLALGLLGLLIYAGFGLGQWLVSRTATSPAGSRRAASPAQAVVMAGMLRWLKLETLALVGYAAWSVVQVGTGTAARLTPAVPLTLVVLVFATVGFFLVWLARAR